MAVSRAFYNKAADYIQIPRFEACLRDAIAYYATLAHEATHWTGHASRLNRDLTGRFGDDAYAAEELIAELRAAYLLPSLASPTSRGPITRPTSRTGSRCSRTIHGRSSPPLPAANPPPTG